VCVSKMTDLILPPRINAQLIEHITTPATGPRRLARARRSHLPLLHLDAAEVLGRVHVPALPFPRQLRLEVAPLELLRQPGQRGAGAGRRGLEPRVRFDEGPREVVAAAGPGCCALLVDIGGGWIGEPREEVGGGGVLGGSGERGAVDGVGWVGQGGGRVCRWGDGGLVAGGGGGGWDGAGGWAIWAIRSGWSG
jgi:hypothetical protein